MFVRSPIIINNTEHRRSQWPSETEETKTKQKEMAG